ncbi:ABC transporter ATP-binding protein [Oscillochloris sp. ZM17-4]|uniref:ABC transporter ATP-binding protein n=1 Tax=Oscillochloris sp. ZM17-4 TaxID=2866714 RepID=UPI001C7319EC
MKTFVADNDMESATLRLMDLARDFSQGLPALNDAILIRSQYSQIRDEQRRLGRTDDVGMQRIRLSILEFVDTLRDQGRHSARRIGDDKSTPEDLPTGSAAEQGVTRSNPPHTFDEERNYFAAQWKEISTSVDRRLVVTEEVSRSYRRGELQFQLDPITLEIHAGEISAIVGTNGSGKTTLLRIIAGEARPHTGRVTYPGLGSSKSSFYSIKGQIAYLPQELKPWSGTLLETLHFTAAIHGLRGEENKIETGFVLHRLRLERYKDVRWSQLSGGYRMRFALANALLSRAKLLVLDEPLANLDINAQQRFLRDLRSQANSLALPLGVVISSQHIHQVEQIADSIIALRDGKNVYQGAVRQFGADRDENIFQIECAASVEQLRVSLEPLGLLWKTAPPRMPVGREDRSAGILPAGCRRYDDCNLSTICAIGPASIA